MMKLTLQQFYVHMLSQGIMLHEVQILHNKLLYDRFQFYVKFWNAWQLLQDIKFNNQIEHQLTPIKQEGMFTRHLLLATICTGYIVNTFEHVFGGPCMWGPNWTSLKMSMGDPVGPCMSYHIISSWTNLNMSCKGVCLWWKGWAIVGSCRARLLYEDPLPLWTEWQTYITENITFLWERWLHAKTRMHSSGMRTLRLLTVSQHALHKGSVYPSMHWAGGVCIPAITGQEGYVSRHALDGGRLPRWGCLPRWVSASGPEGGTVTVRKEIAGYVPSKRCQCQWALPVQHCKTAVSLPQVGHLLNLSFQENQ